MPPWRPGRAAAVNGASAPNAGWAVRAGKRSRCCWTCTARLSLLPAYPVRLDTCLGNQPPGVHGRGERLVVALVLVGVGGGELGDGPVEHVSLAEVGGDRDPVAPAGVRPRQGRAAEPGVLRRAGHEQLFHVRAALPVVE